MKTRHQLLLLLTSAIIFLLLIAYLLLSAISNKNETLLQQGKNDLNQETNKVVSLISLSVENWVFDNTYWDELVSAFKKKDIKWTTENYLPSMYKFGANYLWLINTDGSIFFNSIPESEQDRENIFMDTLLLIDSLKQTNFKHFFVPFKNNIVEIFTAPVQPSSDNNRITPAQGYFITGQIIDTNYFNRISIYTGNNKYELKSTDSINPDLIDETNSIVYYYKPLTDFYNNTFQFIKVTKKLEVINTYKNNLKQYLQFFIGFIMLLFFVVYYFFNTKVISPLSILSQSLEKKNPDILKHLKLKKDEFGQLAALNCNFLIQNDLLKTEIETRKNYEITLKETANELQKETIRAEQSHLAKSEFLSTMSHEIRTPINGVIGISNLLMEEDLTDKQKDFVKILNFSSTHLLSIISDILDFSKIESGNMQFDKSSFDLKYTCQNVINLYESKAKEKNLQLLFVPEKEFTYSIYGDSVRLCQVLTNLLSNAIKFTNKGHVKLEYKTTKETKTHITIEFRIEDTGIGIGKKKLDKVFESFTQADRSISSNYGGTGLGLTISKKLLELQGGKIDLISKLGEGSTFIFHLSFEKNAYVNSLPEPRNKSVRENNLQGMRVLVVEDNIVNTHVLNSFLTKWNVLYENAKNGQVALDKLAESKFDVILMDLHMPIMDGREATMHIRKNKQNNYSLIPIIALTADATSETQHSISSIGFNQYISKPFNPDSLYKILNEYYNVNEN